MKDEVEKILINAEILFREDGKLYDAGGHGKNVETALSKILAIIDKAQVEAVRAELERIDGYAYGTEYGDYQKQRLASLKEDKETK